MPTRRIRRGDSRRLTTPPSPKIRPSFSPILKRARPMKLPMRKPARSITKPDRPSGKFSWKLDVGAGDSNDHDLPNECYIWEKTCAKSNICATSMESSRAAYPAIIRQADGTGATRRGLMIGAQESEFVSAFDWAVVRLATYFPASASQARLLFCSGLPPHKRPPTSSDQQRVGQSQGGKR